MAESEHYSSPFPYCQEEQLEADLIKDCTFEPSYSSTSFNGDLIRPYNLTDHDLFCEDEELSTLLSKQDENFLYRILQNDPSLAMERKEAVCWILRVHSHYSFSLLTALMAVNYLDRFFYSFRFQKDKPWLTQLAAVACLSLAAKVEETYVPLLLDLQVEDTKYLFEPKTIQKMEILVLSTLQWNMNPITPYSFLDYMVRRLGLKDSLCMEFLRRCDIVLLATISDIRFMEFLPSVVAVATMLHVISSVEPCIEEEYQNQLMSVVEINKEKVDECRELILELALEGNILLQSNKRKPVSMPGTPNGVIDVSFSSDNSNDSWAFASSSSSSLCSSPEPIAKR